MKVSLLAAGLTIFASISAAEGSVSQPKSQVQKASTRQLVERFVDAYARRDVAALDRTITKDFTAQVYVTQPVSQITVMTDALTRSWQQQVHLEPSAYARPAIVAIYPTPEAHTLFVTYRVAGQTGEGKRIALVELRGHRVAKMSDFPGSSESTESEKAGLAVAVN